MNVTENFRAATRAEGLDYAGPIQADGKLHRFKAVGDHARNSWYVLHDGTPASGAFGCWKRGFKKTWCDRNNNLSPAEWQQVRQRWEAAEREREQTEAARHVKARATAAWIFKRSQPARPEHPYLSQKGAEIFGELRERHGALVLPLRDATGELHSLQFIRDDGSKRFLTGGRIAGCGFTLSDRPDGALVLCEGYATGASIHEATGFAVVCAMHAGNLKTVATGLRERFSDREIIIAADNDQFTAGNPGLMKTTEAARAIGAKLAAPQFQDVSTKPTDFNDLHRLAGLPEVARQIQSASQPAPAAPDLPAAPPKNVSKPVILLPDEPDEPEAAPFPIECLPPDIALMVRGVAVALRVPDSMPGLMALALTSASIGKGLVLKWSDEVPPTPANLFVMLSAESGTGKSVCYKKIAASFLAFERDMQDYWRKEFMPQLQADLRFAEGQLKKLDRKLAKDSTTEQEAERCRAEQKYHLAQKSELEAKLHEPQLSIQDATVEKAAAVMHWNDETIFSTSSDARKLVDNLLGRYSANKNLADDGIYLNAFSGDDVKVDRQGREGVRLANPCLTLLWALQPDALDMLLGEQSLQQGGFLARCLLAHTHAEPQLLGEAARDLSDDTRNHWENLIRDLLFTYRQPRTLPAREPESLD
jgi:putative DNA primase/helicase